MKKSILLFALSSLFLTACQEQNSEQTETTLMKVNVVQVQPATLTHTLRLSGSITAKEDIAVGTPLLGLQIQTVNVEVGNLTDSNALFHLARNGELEATVEASAEELSLLKTGLPAEVQVLDQTTSGQIRLLSSQIDQTSRTGNVRIQLQTPTQLTLGTPQPQP